MKHHGSVARDLRASVGHSRKTRSDDVVKRLQRRVDFVNACIAFRQPLKKNFTGLATEQQQASAM
jgi:hypothetical protein